MKFPKKSLGQNFLIDKNIIKKIVSLISIKDKNVVEIGPGKGALTEEILKKKPKSLTLIEKDNEFSEKLKIRFSGDKSIKIINEDILNFNLEREMKSNSIIFGNLPYNISSQILIKILRFNKWPPNFHNVVFMFQKELGEKIAGKFKTKDYGRISIISSYRLKIIKKFLISPNCFFPKPKINSIILHFKPKDNILFKIKKITNLEKITNLFFSNKRKMINKSLKKIFTDKEIKSIPSLKENLRPTEVDPETYYKITEIFERK
jgi:16S rRNA (adenine1518-N6/adenine1519-N6)-dimethyltransferase